MQEGSPQKKRKKSVNVSLDAELVAEARAAGVNISAVLERALHEQLKERRWAEWREENREAIAASNRYVEQHGLPLAKFRTW